MKKSNPKVILIALGLFLFILIIAMNVGYVTLAKKHLRTGVNILDFQKNKALAEVVEMGKRGTIYDRNNEVIAQDIERYQIFLVLDKNLVSVVDKIPLHVVDIEKTADVLNKHLGIPKEEAIKILSQSELKQVEIGEYGKKISKETKEAIEAEELPGVRFKQVLDRVYPSGHFSSNILGFARYNGKEDRIVGEMGLEAYLDDYLKGSDGLKRYKIGKHGQIIPGEEETVRVAQNGNDVHLTLDSNIQSSLETMLHEDTSIDRWAVVMNAKTGELLAAGNSRDFDLNKKDIKNYNNIVADVSYEPGSISKVFTYSAAFDTDNVDESLQIETGKFYVGLKDGVPYRASSSEDAINVIKDATAHGEYVSYKKGIALSTNTTAIDLLVNHMKRNIFLDYLDKFELYKNIEIEGINSVAGVQNTKGPLEMVNTAFGQGSTTTAMNIVQGFSAIVNNGIMSKPYIIDYVIDPKTKEKKKETVQVHKEILKKSTAEKMNDYLRAPIEEPYGTGYMYRLNDVKILGKTGTAEIVVNGRYSDDTYIKSVMIAAPASDPEVIIYYAQKSGLYYPMKADRIKDLVKISLDTLSIEAKKEEKAGETSDFNVSTMPNFINHSLNFIEEDLQKMHVEVIKIGDGERVIAQYPNINDDVPSKRKVYLYTGGAIVMPDMKDWTYKEIVQFSRISGIGISIKGSGLVKKQNIAPKSTINKESDIVVELSP